MAEPTQAPNGYQVGSTRAFIQEDGSYPDAAYVFQGCLSLAESEQDLGDSTPVYCPSTERPNTWVIVDTIIGTPGLPTVDFTARLPRDLRDSLLDIAERNCKFNLQQKIFCNGLPQDQNAWDAKWLMLGGRMTSRTIPMANPLSGEDNAIADFTGSITYEKLIRLLKLTFGTKGSATVVSEILDGFFYDVVSCGNCGATPSDGCQKQYWLAAASGGSPGLSSRIVYTINGGATYGQLNITPLAASSARRIAPMGQYLIGVGVTASGHFYELFSEIDAGTTNFTLVTSGYTTAPRALVVKSPSEAFIAGAGGYIYFLSDPTGTPTVLTDGSLSAQDLNDIHFSGNTVVAVGASNAVLYSENNGETFTSVTGPAVGVTLNAVWVLNTGVWWVGTANGKLYWTRNKGVTWTQQANVNSTNSSVDDIYFVDENVGYVVSQTGTVGRVYSTHNAGNSWQLASSTDPRLQGVPTALRFNVVTGCGYNTVGIGGAVTAGGDGVIAIAE